MRQVTNEPRPDQAIVFDLGGVLIDWDPRHMYRKLFADEAEMERFLTGIATLEWNGRHDAGRPWREGVDTLSSQYPEHADLIAAYWERWEEMLGGPIEGTVDILRRLKSNGQELHALTNWSTETFPIARRRFEFLTWFETIVVSGEERLIKPDPALYEVLLARIGRKATECIFIDDNVHNIATAARLGFDAIRFVEPQQLADALEARGI